METINTSNHTIELRYCESNVPLTIYGTYEDALRLCAKHNCYIADSEVKEEVFWFLFGYCPIDKDKDNET